MRYLLHGAVLPSAIVVLASAGPAHAYLDPGTASIILQGLIGGGVAAASFVAIYWRRFLSFFSRKKEKTEIKEKEQA